jgi:hypothetical protein
MTTFQSLIRQYAHMVADGHSDTDLSPRQRRMVQVLLNTASNLGWAVVAYPPTDDTRGDIIAEFLRGQRDSNAFALAQAAGPAVDRDYSLAIERTVNILRGI